MTLREKQSRFAQLVARLITYAYAIGYEVTLGDAYATSGHCENSFHYKRLAIDLNLFRDGKYLDKTEDHLELGLYWKGLDPNCSWGGDFTDSDGTPKPDGNHYSYGEGR